VSIEGGTAYVARGDAGLAMIDISDLMHPQAVRLVEIPEGIVLDVAVAGGLAYVADYWAGVRILDLRDPSRPSEVSVFREASQTTAVLLDGTHLYVGAADKLWVMDVSDPIDPVPLAVWDSGGGFIRSLARSGDRLYLSAGDVHILDMSDLAAPREIAFFGLQEPVEAVDAHDGYVYLVNDGGLWILEVQHQCSSPAAARQDSDDLPLLMPILSVSRGAPRSPRVNQAGRTVFDI